ncbi:MAG: biopolymer transporter ExbD [Proteobacteria bacterium]|nr:biopolymer transporter ExbD [Pseudomonadota bacterium]
MAKLFKKKETSIELNLTSLMDMFTIILFFFLTTYSFEGVLMQLVEGIELPKAKTTIPIAEKFYIAVGKDRIDIDGKIYSNTGRDDSFILKELRSIKSKGKNYLVIQADKELPFYMVRNYIRLAVQAGFSKPYLAVLPK